MQAHTLDVVLSASRDDVFRLLADVEALPRWAAAFCERVDLIDGGWLALTAAGEFFCEVEADDRTGVIDLRLAMGGEPPGLMPLRVLALPGGGTLVTVTLLRPPLQSAAQFHRLRRALHQDLQALGRRLRGERFRGQLQPADVLPAETPVAVLPAAVSA